jgi:7-keto-8-aminopelargonate synthetase-like enzyme
VSCWNANEGLTASIVEEGDFVLSDELNHASIIDSIRLAKSITKCTTGVFKHSDMDDLVAADPPALDHHRDPDARRENLVTAGPARGWRRGSASARAAWDIDGPGGV